MEWVRDRFAQTLEPTDLTAVDNSLVIMRDGLLDGELPVTTDEAQRLLDLLAGIQQSTGS